MRAKELRERSTEELQRVLGDNRSQLFQFRLKNATHQMDKTAKIRQMRREIARIATVLVQRTKEAAAESVSTKGGEE